MIFVGRRPASENKLELEEWKLTKDSGRVYQRLIRESGPEWWCKFPKYPINKRSSEIYELMRDSWISNNLKFETL